jgi:small-conductance mechanosensitive channel
MCYYIRENMAEKLQEVKKQIARTRASIQLSRNLTEHDIPVPESDEAYEKLLAIKMDTHPKTPSHRSATDEQRRDMATSTARALLDDLSYFKSGRRKGFKRVTAHHLLNLLSKASSWEAEFPEVKAAADMVRDTLENQEKA